MSVNPLVRAFAESGIWRLPCVRNPGRPFCRRFRRGLSLLSPVSPDRERSACATRNASLTMPAKALTLILSQDLPTPLHGGDSRQFRFLPGLSSSRPRCPCSEQVRSCPTRRTRRSIHPGHAAAGPAEIRLAFCAIRSPSRAAPIRTRFVCDLIAQSRAGAVATLRRGATAPRQGPGLRYNDLRLALIGAP
jgi:hypothetical protein